MSDTSYPIEIRQASKNGYFTPAESNAYYAARYARDGITVHWWGDGTGADNHDNIVNYMNNQAAQAIKSVNYVLSDNKITMCVPPDDVAWCSEKGNPTTISVETQPTLGAEGYKKWGWLVNQLEQRYGKTLALHRHSEWTQTSCPGSIDLNRIRAEADKWKSGIYDATPAPSLPLYSVEPITPKQIKVKSGSRKWNLAYADFNSVAANPIIIADDNTVFTATAILHHSHIPQYNYYLEDANTPHGWNVLDCLDYTAPVPVPKPPAAPIEVPKVTYYDIKPDIIMYYGNALDAQSRRNALGTKNKGTYILLGSDEQARQIVKKNTDRDIIWVNDFDNKLEEVKLDVPAVPTLPVDPPKVVTEVTDVADNTAPVPIPQPIQDIQVSRPKLKPKYFPINPDRSPVRLTTTNTTAIVINSLEGDLPSQKLPAHWSGTFTMYGVVGADIYYLPDETLTKGWYYGIKEQFLPKKTSFFDMNRDGRVTIDDVYEGMRFVMTPARQAYTRLIQPVITDLRTDRTKQAVSRITRAVDGFSSTRKKGK